MSWYVLSNESELPKFVEQLLEYANKDKEFVDYVVYSLVEIDKNYKRVFYHWGSRDYNKYEQYKQYMDWFFKCKYKECLEYCNKVVLI